MGRRLRVGCVAVCAVLALARVGYGEEFGGYGPLPVRNYQPIQLIFLNLPFERARTLPPGAFTLHLESVESNVVATHQGYIDALLKFETNRTVLGGAAGVMPGLEVGLNIPFISRFGGFLDPFIDSVEDLFGISNIERKIYPNNSFAGFTVRQGDTMLFDGKKQQFELGDIWASAKYEAWHRDGWPLVSVRGAIKAPTGRADSVFGSGKPDFGLGVAAEQQFLRWLLVYGNLDMVYPLGPITDARLTLNPIVIQHLGAEAYVGRGVSLVLQQSTYTSPIHGVDAPVLDGTVVEFSGGVNWWWRPLLVQFGIVDNVSGVETSADFSMMLRLTYRRDAP